MIRGDREKLEFVAFWLAEGRVLAGMNVNTWGVTDQIASLVESNRVVDPGRLEDPDVDISELANQD